MFEPLDLDTIGFFLYMEEQEQEEESSSNEWEQEEDSYSRSVREKLDKQKERVKPL